MAHKKILQFARQVIFVVLIVGGLRQPVVHAQDSAGGVRNGRGSGHEEIRFLRIANERNVLTLHTEYEQQKQTLASSGEDPARRSRILFQEGLDMDFRGSVYHPKFMDFDLSLGILPEQDREKSNLQASSDDFRNSHLSRYRFNSYFLKEKPLNFSFFGESQREVSNRDFFERQIVDRSGYGGRLNFRHDVLPADLSYNHSEQDIDRSFRPDQSFNDEMFSVHLAPRWRNGGDTDIDYARDRYRRVEAGTSEQNGTSDSVNLTNRREWDEASRKNLTTYFHYFSLEDTRDSRNLTLDEYLTWDHTDVLQTFYRYNLSDDAVEGAESTGHKVTAGVKHQLYESLASTLIAGGTALNTSSFDQKEFNAAIVEDYTKHIGLAVLGLGVDYLFERRKRDSLDTVLNIVNESHRLDDTTVVFLNQIDVDTSRITVTDSTGTTVYVEDIDYQIIQHLSGFTEIKRIVTGSIAAGAEVLVDYLVKNNPSFSFSTGQDNYRFSLGLWENKLQFYSRYRRQRHFDREGESNLVLEQFKDAMVGCQLDLAWTSWSVEYEDYGSDLNPYTALRLREDFTWDISPKAVFTLRSSQDYVNLADDDRESYDVRGKYSLRLTRTSTGIWEGGYRQQKGQDVNVENLTSRTTYRLNVGQLSFESGYEFEKEYSLGNDLDNHYVFTTLKRQF